MDFDAIVIGAGMSGIAAAIRLAMFNKKVLVLESHSIPGGLNSYYSRDGRDIDVGLHALTNFCTKSERTKPLMKLLKQLRIHYDDLELEPQKMSRIWFRDHQLRFTNDIDYLIHEVTLNFPRQLDAFLKLIKFVEEYNDTDLTKGFIPAKTVVYNLLKNRELVEMIFCPLLIYGSALSNDMDLSQFVTMFKSIYLQGFARPARGVRTIIDLLMKRAEEVGVEFRFNARVKAINTLNNAFQSVALDNGEKIKAHKVFSSAGAPETLKLINKTSSMEAPVGEMSFTETILFTDKLPRDAGINDSIIFYNNSNRYRYERPFDYFDPNSCVLCFPQNYHPKTEFSEGIVRFTFISNYNSWKDLKEFDPAEYRRQKLSVAMQGKRILNTIFPNFKYNVLYQDTFTPVSVEKFTHHINGTVYGSPTKFKDGVTEFKNVYFIGTDQGFLGIVGSILSGISIANLHGLQDELK